MACIVRIFLGFCSIRSNFFNILICFFSSCRSGFYRKLKKNIYIYILFKGSNCPSGNVVGGAFSTFFNSCDRLIITYPFILSNSSLKSHPVSSDLYMNLCMGKTCLSPHRFFNHNPKQEFLNVCRIFAVS